MRRIYRRALTTTSGGNISLRHDDGAIWISPASLDKGALAPAEVVRVAPDGSSTGPYKPSLEYPFHRAIYQARPDLRAIVHAHPADLVAFSIARKIPDTAITPHSLHTCGAVGYASYAIPGSPELGDNIAASFAGGFNCVLLENHGAVAAGQSLLHAFHRFEALDNCARLHIQASRLGTPRKLSSEDLKLSRSADMHEFTPPAPAEREAQMRQQICTMVHRACEQQLMTSSAGSFSARLDAASFLITPGNIDRQLLSPGDIVLITDSGREASKLPAAEVHLHQQIYKEHPEIASIVTAAPTSMMAFGVTGAHLDTRIIPESYFILRDLPSLPFAARNDHDRISKTLGRTSPVIMIQHQAVIATGTTILQAFDRLEVGEFTARSIIAAKMLGGAVTLSDTQAAEIREAFF